MAVWRNGGGVGLFQAAVPADFCEEVVRQVMLRLKLAAGLGAAVVGGLRLGLTQLLCSGRQPLCRMRGLF